ncbi:MAG: hypothetical protein JSW49_03130 [candidate division WOR-3 bacterium]|nr:MAG: hypothetical protein JSW49_03130 [candidate division WOR-3 bacterium]
MSHRLAIVSFTFVLMAIVCAHKAAPIAKDRLRPRLSNVAVINRRQIQLTFTEDIDTLSLTPDNISITSASETLGVLMLYPSLSASEILIVTQPMENVAYEIRGEVLDKAENKGTFTRRVQGSTTSDTIAPWVTRFSEGKSRHEFYLHFSEAMDTTDLTFSIMPRKEFRPEWMNHRRALLMPANPTDTLGSDSVYYIYVKKGSDISGNALKPFITQMTHDTISLPITLRCKAMIDGNPVEKGLAILSRDEPINITFVTAGEFTFVVPDSLESDVLVVSDTYSGRARVSVTADNIIHLRPEKIDVDSIID